MRYCKYKVVTQEHFETFESEQMAKRAYGIIKRRIKYSDTSLTYVLLYIKPTKNSEWEVLLECFLEKIDGTKKYITESFDLNNESDELDNSI